MAGTRLIFCDGICGSGKTSTALFVALQLRENGVPAKFMVEGSAVHVRGIYRPPREGIPPAYLEGEILDPKAKVLCSPEDYMKRGLEAWRKFAAEVEDSDEIIVLDGHFFHAATDDLHFIDADPELSVQYVPQIVEIIRDLNPVLIHLYQRDVEASLRKTCTSRGRMWTRHQVDWKVVAPYSYRKGYEGFDGLVKQFADFHTLCDGITKALPIETLQVDVLDGEWAAYYEQIMDFLSGVLGQILKPIYRLSGNSPYSEIVDGGVQLWGEPGLRDMQKLKNVRYIKGRLDVVYSPDLESLDGLEGLVELGTLRLSRNNRLTNLKALRNLRKLTRLDLAANNALTSLDGLQHIEEFDGGIEINCSSGLRNVDELTSISDVASLHLSANPVLQHLEGLRFVKSNRGRMTITDHRVLESLEGLRSLERIDHEVELSYNDRVVDLDGLRNVTHIGGDLKVVHNPLLENLEGLSNLQSVGDVYIVENGRLLQHEVDKFLTSLKQYSEQF